MIFSLRSLYNVLPLTNILFSLCISTILFACSDNTKKESETILVQDTVKKTVVIKDSFPVILKPWMIARGSEPGWFAQFYDDSVSMELDNGEKKLSFNYDFSKVEDRNFTAKIQSVVSENGKQSKENIKIIVQLKPCTEEGSGEKRERSIQLNYNDKTYRGCATVDL